MLRRRVFRPYVGSHSYAVMPFLGKPRCPLESACPSEVPDVALNALRHCKNSWMNMNCRDTLRWMRVNVQTILQFPQTWSVLPGARVNMCHLSGITASCNYDGKFFDEFQRSKGCSDWDDELPRYFRQFGWCSVKSSPTCWILRSASVLLKAAEVGRLGNLFYFISLYH